MSKETEHKSPTQAGKVITIPTREEKEKTKKTHYLTYDDEPSKQKNEDFKLYNDEDIKRLYAVAVGRVRGVFKEWNECYNSGNNYPGALYKAFITKEQAGQFLILQRYNTTEEDIDSTGSLKPHQKTRPLFSSEAKIPIYSPTTSKSSRSARRKKTHFNELNVFPSLTHSQRNPKIGEEDKFSSGTSTNLVTSDLQAICPIENHHNLALLIDSGMFT